MSKVLKTPTPFPEQIVTLTILQTSKESETILDLFCGSGTVGRFAFQH